MLLLQRGPRRRRRRSSSSSSSSNNNNNNNNNSNSSKPSVQKRSKLLQLCCAAPAVAEGDLGKDLAGSSPSARGAEQQPAAQQLHQQQAAKQQQCRLSIDVRAPPNAAGMVPLTQDSLSTATALFGGFSHNRKGPKHHQDTKDSPSEIHSDLQQETKALCSSSTCTTSSSSQQPRSTPPPSNASSPQQQLPSCYASDSLPGVDSNSNLQQQQQESSTALLPHKQHVQALQQQCSQAADGLGAVALTPAGAATAAAAVLMNQHKHSSLVTVSTSCQATTSSVAGWSETVISQPAAAAAATTAAPAAAATASSQDAGAADAPAAAPDGPEESLSLPPELTGKLRKLESGRSFRMLQPELSDSLLASDGLTNAGSESGSTSFGLLTSDSSTAAGSGLGTVSGRSNPPPLGASGLARLSTQSLQAQNPSSSSTEEGPQNSAGCGALPATIPEHVCVTDGVAATSSAAVAAAFEADAAALQGLVAAAAELPPVPKPHHSRSKSAGQALDISAAADQSAGAAAASGSGSGSMLAATGHFSSRQPQVAAGPSSTPGASAGAGQTAATAAAATAVAASAVAPNNPLDPAGGAKAVVMRTFSAYSSPFAQMDLQQTVTAALLNQHHHHHQQQQQRLPASASSAAAAAAGGGGAAARPASAADAPAGSRTSLSSYRSTPPYSLQSMVQVQQQTGSSLGASRAHQNHALPASNSLRPSLTSKLSWASGVTAAAAEPQEQFFALLAQPQGFAGAGSSSDRPAGQQQEGEQEKEEGSVGRGILQPSKSLSQAGSSRSSFLRAAKSFSSLPSFGRGDSSGNSSSSNVITSGGSLETKASNKGGKGKGSPGAFSFQRVKSAAALLSGLKGFHSQPTPVTTTAAAAAAGPGGGRATTAAAAAADVGTSPDGSRGSGAGSSSNSSGSGSNSRLAAAVSVPASPLRSILRLPSSKLASSKHHARVSLGASTPLQEQREQREEEGVLMHAASSNRSSGLLASPGSARPRSPLPPLPRPQSGLGLDAAAAVSGSSSSNAAEGPFAAQQHSLGMLDSLLPAGAAAAATSSRRSIAVTSAAHPSALRQTASTSSIGQVSSSGSSSGTGGSLICLAVTRLHSAAAASAAAASGSCGNLATAGGAASSSVLASQQSGSLPGLDSASLSALPSSSKSSTEVGRAFAEAFLAALASGNVKWASDKAVGELLAESAKMVGLDRQLHVGKATIIRRLNGGMDQLVKMAQATATDSSSSSSAADAAADAAAATTAAGGGGSSSSSSSAAAALAARLPKPQLTVSCPDPKGRPSVVEAVYTFKWGIRKFTMRDEFIVRGGQILRLQRSRG